MSNLANGTCCSVYYQLVTCLQCAREYAPAVEECGHGKPNVPLPIPGYFAIPEPHRVPEAKKIPDCKIDISYGLVIGTRFNFAKTKE